MRSARPSRSPRAASASSSLPPRRRAPPPPMCRTSLWQTMGCWLLLSALGMLLVGIWSLSGWTEDRAADSTSSESNDLIVTKQGDVDFLSLRDWPVERKDGIVRPAPIETYLSMKFGQVAIHLQAIRHRLDALEQRVQQLETDRDTILQRLATLEQPSAPSRQPTASPAPSATAPPTP